MLTPTHLVTGQTAFLLAAAFAGHDPTPAQAVTAAFASIIPDLDSSQSYLGRLVPFLSGPVEYQFGHRALTHSLLAQAVLGYAAWLLLPFGFFLALVAGWVPHSVADMMTPSGVAWFWPSRVRCVMPGNVRYRMESMSRGELGFLVVMALTGVLLLPLARTGEGATGLIRSAIGDLDAARAEYDAGKGAHAFALEVQRHSRAFPPPVTPGPPVPSPPPRVRASPAGPLPTRPAKREHPRLLKPSCAHWKTVSGSWGWILHGSRPGWRGRVPPARAVPSSAWRI
jgi:inner membrane protein